jgi:hypothetical protein
MSRRIRFAAALFCALLIAIGSATYASGATAEPTLTLKLVKSKNVKVTWSFAALATRAGSTIEIQRSVNGASFITMKNVAKPAPSASWTDQAVPQGALRYQARLVVNNAARAYGPIAHITMGSAPATITSTSTSTTSTTTTSTTTSTSTTTTTTVAPTPATGAYRWAKTSGGPTFVDNALVSDVAIAPDGTVIAAGSFSGTANFGRGARTSAGSTDAFVVAYNAAGTALWDRTFGSTGSDSGAGVAAAPTGEVVVAGTFAGTVNFGGTSATTAAGSGDAYFAVLATTTGATIGNAVAIGGPDTDGAIDVAVRDGAIAVTGSFSGTGSFGGRTLTSSGYDIFLAKYALATGTGVWGVRLGGGSLDRGWSVAIDGTGAVVVAAEQGTTTASQALLAKLNSATGAAVWPARTFANASGASVAIAPGDDIVLAGTFSTTINFGGATFTAQGIDVFVARLAPNGTTHRWSRQFGGPPPFSFTDTATGVAVDAAGNTLLTGAVIDDINFGGGMLVKSGGSDPFLVKLSPTGTHVWSKRFASGDQSYQRPGGVATGPGNAVATAGGMLGRMTIDAHQFDARYLNNGQLLANNSMDSYVAVFAP